MEKKKILLVCFLLPLKRDKNVWHLQAIPPFGHPWPSCLLPSHSLPAPPSRGDPLEEGMAARSSILAWRIPWTESGSLYSIGLQRVRNNWSNLAHRLVIAFLPRSKCLNFMAAVTFFSDFGAQKNKVSHCFHSFPIYLPWNALTRLPLL